MIFSLKLFSVGKVSEIFVKFQRNFDIIGKRRNFVGEYE